MSLRFFVWLEHLLGFIVIHSGGSSPGLIPFMPLGNMLNGRTHHWSGAAGKRSCRWCNPELMHLKNCSAILLLFATPLPCYPAWMVEREPIPVASPIFEGVVGK